MSGRGVELVVNVWERSHRRVLDEGVIAQIAADHDGFAFERRTVLINNVDDLGDALARAEAARERGEVDHVAVVAEHLDEALARAGMTRRDLGRIPHYTDCSLVAVFLDGPEHLLYWDADVRLAAPGDWVTPALELLERDPRIAVVNPSWTDDTLGVETLEQDGPWAIGQGFSDQLFLVRRSDLRRPEVYGTRCLAELRFPMAHVARVFESRVDAWMRHHGRLRGTWTPLTYVHPAETAGTSYPAFTARERARALGVRAGLAALRATPRPLRPRCCRTI